MEFGGTSTYDMTADVLNISLRCSGIADRTGIRADKLKIFILYQSADATCLHC